MQILYADCFSGISGDMLLGALIGLGINNEILQKEISRIAIGPYQLKVNNVKRGELSCTQCSILHETNKNVFRNLSDIENLIENSELVDPIKKKALSIFNDLGEIEAKIHNVGITDIHFHELGAVDTLVDVIGVLLALRELGIGQFYSSALHLGQGITNTLHGPIPVPAPATLEILRDIPVVFTDVNAELVTPTGAILMKHLVDHFCSSPKFKIKKIAYGAGARDLASRPNCLRLILGESAESLEKEDTESVECDIDDMNPQFYPYLMNRLYEIGALDVTLTQVIMKKGRPGTRVTVLCEKDKMEDIISILITETTTIGIRTNRVQRYKSHRNIEKIKTKYGLVRIKCAWMNNQITNIAPEYEDCFKIARKYNKPLKQVYQEIFSSALKKLAVVAK